MAAAQGNNYAAKDKLVRAAILRALEEESRVDRKNALDEIARVIVKNAKTGDLASFKEIADRIDGKSVQQTEISGPNGGPVTMLASQLTDDQLATVIANGVIA